MRENAIATAMQLVERTHPDCWIAVLAGSASRNETFEHSDLDLVIVDPGEVDSFRRVIRESSWVVELFVLSPETYRDLFDEGIRIANPSLQRMLAEGIVLRSRPEGLKLQDEARSDLELGPLPWTSYERDFARYTITDYMEDLAGATKRWEAWFTASELACLLCRFVLRTNDRWLGEGKHLYRALAAFAPETAVKLEQALGAFYEHDDRGPLLELAGEVLEPHGGPLLVGYEA